MFSSMRITSSNFAALLSSPEDLYAASFSRVSSSVLDRYEFGVSLGRSGNGRPADFGSSNRKLSEPRAETDEGGVLSGVCLSVSEVRAVRSDPTELRKNASSHAFSSSTLCFRMSLRMRWLGVLGCRTLIRGVSSIFGFSLRDRTACATCVVGLEPIGSFSSGRSLLRLRALSGKRGVAGGATLDEPCEVRWLVVDVRRTCPKLTPRLCSSEGRIVAMTGGLLGHTELVKEFRDKDERGIDILLCLERARLEEDWLDVRRLPFLNISMRSPLG